MNITKADSFRYQIMVAIPINKSLKSEGDIFIRRMLYNGNLLMTEVRGGRNTINNALVQLTNYVRDHQYTSPAIPYESPVTDRIAEPDTTRWVTRIYYPIF